MTPAIAPALGMEAVAAATGYSWERFRKVWPSLPGFPAPIKRPRHGRGSYAWRPESVEAWLRGREAGLGAHSAPPPANDTHAPRQAHQAAVQRQREALGRLMGAR